MKHIITRNYTDRETASRWLVRREDQTREEATPCKTLKATGVSFAWATGDTERAVGCIRVGITEAEPLMDQAAEPPTEAVRLRFDGSGFYAGEDEVHKAAELILQEDGSMLAVL